MFLCVTGGASTKGYHLEAYFAVVVSVWLCACFVWMFGETHTHDDDVVGPISFHFFEVCACARARIVYLCACVRLVCASSTVRGVCRWHSAGNSLI